MLDLARVARMRRLIDQAVPTGATNTIAGRVFHGVTFEDPICAAIRRRSMVMQIDMAARHYNLGRDVDAFLAAAGQCTLSALTTPQLDVLATFVSDVMDRLSHACDHPDDPPAR